MMRHRRHLPIKLLHPALTLGVAAVVVPAVVTPAVRLGIPTPVLIALGVLIVAMFVLGRAGRGMSYQNASRHKRHRRCQAKAAASGLDLPISDDGSTGKRHALETVASPPTLVRGSAAFTFPA